MERLPRLTCGILLSGILIGEASAALTFHVDAGNGRDDQDGTAQRPFATLTRARDAVRASRTGGPAEAAVIEISGDFAVTDERQRLLLDWRDSGTTWQAGPRGARFTGAYRLTARDFAPVADPATLGRLRESARGRVVVCDLKRFGLGPLKPLPRQFTQWSEMELFAYGRDMTIARYPNTGWIRIPHVVDRGVKPVDRKTGEWEHGYKGGTFAYEGDEPARWDVSKGVYMKGFWCHDWCSETLRVASIDTVKRHITSEGIHSYGIGNHAKWHTAKRRYYVYNLLEELDAPGEWFLDRETRLLYFYPIGGRFEDVALSVQKQPLIAVGGATNVTLRGLAFTYTSGLALEVARSRGVVLDGVEVSYVSQTGVKLWDCRESTVTNCRLWQIGGTGLQIHGGDRKTLTPSKNRVTGCEIHHCARLSRISGPCLTFGGCGNRIDHNSFHDTPYIAVTYGGNDNVFEYNDVACAMMESGDGGGVYTGRDWGSQGNVIRYNYFHHFGADGVAWRRSQGVAPEYEPLKESVMVMGLYLDDCDSGDTVYGNLFYKAGWAMFCGGGRDNKWRDNLCIDCTSAAQLDIRGLKRARPGEGTKDGWDLLKKLQDLNWQRPPWSTRYPWLVDVMANDPKLPIGTEFTGNVAIRCGVFFRMWGDTFNVLNDRLVCSDNVLVGPPNAQEAKWFAQTNAALRAKLRLETNAEVESLADSPRTAQDAPAFRREFPRFPRIPVEEIGPPR
ncbi:MAG: right-handed parallel beta-helix repeat-containing protein [Kiritimatiellia bacterium]